VKQLLLVNQLMMKFLA